MKVRELIELLEQQDPEAEILLMNQSSWPFEHALTGIAVRADLVDEDEDVAADTAEGQSEDGTALADVFIVEGRQLRYGSKAAWDVATR